MLSVVLRVFFHQTNLANFGKLRTDTKLKRWPPTEAKGAQSNLAGQFEHQSRIVRYLQRERERDRDMDHGVGMWGVLASCGVDGWYRSKIQFEEQIPCHPTAH